MGPGQKRAPSTLRNPKNMPKMGRNVHLLGFVLNIIAKPCAITPGLWRSRNLHLPEPPCFRVGRTVDEKTFLVTETETATTGLR